MSFEDVKPNEAIYTSSSDIRFYSRVNLAGLTDESRAPFLPDVRTSFSVTDPSGRKKVSEKGSGNQNWQVSLPQEGVYRVEAKALHPRVDLIQESSPARVSIYADRSAPIVTLLQEIKTDP